MASVEIPAATLGYTYVHNLPQFLPWNHRLKPWVVSFPEFKVWSLWSLLHFKLEAHHCNLNRWGCNLNRWPFNLDPWRTHPLCPSSKLWARGPFPSPATHTLSWCMVKIPCCFHAIGLLSDKNRRPQCLSSFQDEIFSTFLLFSSSSFKKW